MSRPTAGPENLPDAMSRQIEFLRMFLVLGIMCIHYGRMPGQDLLPLDGYAGQEHGVSVFLISYVVFLALCGVPILSAISGFLFFRNTSASNPPAFAKRLHRRFKSLFVPLLIWNGLVLVAALIFYGLAPNDTVTGLLGFDPSKAVWFDYVDAWIGITRHPIVYPMWFVRDLLLTALLTPIWWLLVQRAWWLGLVILGSAWLVGHDLWIFFRTDIPFFFYLGILVAINNWQITLPRKTALGLMALYLILIAVRVWIPSVIGTEANFWVDAATRVLRFLGVVALWTTVPMILDAGWVKAVSRWSPYAFFTHCGHFPLISVINYVILVELLPYDSNSLLLLHFVLAVSSTLLLLFFGGMILKRVLPAVFFVLSGSRREVVVGTEADKKAGRKGSFALP